MTGQASGGPLRAVVAAVEVFAAIAAVAAVVLLFANEPGERSVDPSAAAVEPGAIDGAAVFADQCAACHGADAGGGIGPALAGGAVVAAFPDAADQTVVVIEGRGGMPSFGDRLSADEIDAVVEYTRSL